MSTMLHPEACPDWLLVEMAECHERGGGCEPERRPRMAVCSYHGGWWDGREAAETTLARVRETIRRMDRHVIELGESGWAIEHSLSCRRDGMLRCPVDRQMRHVSDGWDGPPRPLGRYYVDGTGVIGDPVTEDDPVSDLLATLKGDER